MSVQMTRPAPVLDVPGASPNTDAGVIKEAKRRRRRRRAVLAAVIAPAALGAWLALFGQHRSELPRPHLRATAPTVLALDPNTLFSQSPYMGVACRIPSWIGCDRIGLTIWLRRPALAITANIDGRSFQLNNPIWSGPEHAGLHTRFAGFLQPAGITSTMGVTTQPGAHWSGANAPDPFVSLLITEPDQRTIQATVNVPLMAGWG